MSPRTEKLKELRSLPEIRKESAEPLTRSQVASLMGISTSAVIHLERKGKLHPSIQRGVHLFDPVEVHDVARQRLASGSGQPLASTAGRTAPRYRRFGPRNNGRLAATVFQLLEENKTLRQIVIETRIPPVHVRELYHEWSISLEDGERMRTRRRHQKGESPVSDAPATPPPRPKTNARPRSRAARYEADADLNVLLTAAENLFDKKD